MIQKNAQKILIEIIKFFIVSFIALIFSIPILFITHSVLSNVLHEGFFTFHLYDLIVFLIIKAIIWISIATKK